MTFREGRSIVVDARGLTQSGIGRYLREVLRGIVADPRFTQLTLLGHVSEIRSFLGGSVSGRVRIISFPYGFYSAVAQVRWALLSTRGLLRGDVAFFPHYDVPLPPARTKSVVTVQDLAHFELPELFAGWKRRFAAPLLRNAVSRADRVLVTSRHTEAALLARFPWVRGKLVRIPLGVAEDFGRRPASPSVGDVPVAALGTFLLCVGNRKPHKNVIAAVEVLSRLRAELPNLRLVIAGRRFKEDDGVGARAEALGVSDAVLDVGVVRDDELRALYRSAAVFLFPSLYEGFGLPILEAMACGAPVVAASRASIPEVVGDAGTLAGPMDYDAMAAAVRHLLSDERYRAELVERGVARAGELSWVRTARATADVLWEVASGGARGSTDRDAERARSREAGQTAR